MTGPEAFTPGPIADRRRDFIEKMVEKLPSYSKDDVIELLGKGQRAGCRAYANSGVSTDISENYFNYTVELQSWRRAFELVKQTPEPFPYPEQPPSIDETCRVSQIWHQYRIENGIGEIASPAATVPGSQEGSSRPSGSENKVSGSADQAPRSLKRNNPPRVKDLWWGESCGDESWQKEAPQNVQTLAGQLGEGGKETRLRWVQGPGNDEKHTFPGALIPEDSEWQDFTIDKWDATKGRPGGMPRRNELGRLYNKLQIDYKMFVRYCEPFETPLFVDPGTSVVGNEGSILANANELCTKEYVRLRVEPALPNPWGVEECLSLDITLDAADILRQNDANEEVMLAVLTTWTLMLGHLRTTTMQLVSEQAVTNLDACFENDKRRMKRAMLFGGIDGRAPEISQRLVFDEARMAVGSLINKRAADEDKKTAHEILKRLICVELNKVPAGVGIRRTFVASMMVPNLLKANKPWLDRGRLNNIFIDVFTSLGHENWIPAYLHGSDSLVKEDAYIAAEAAKKNVDTAATDAGPSSLAVAEAGVSSSKAGDDTHKLI
ncbi:hypothetical protein F5B20DRAFT_578185 [Whalleya microplaca]|nr:hypothetical protein F5B20DRAFT_578185 [Whalleya microplaca]